MRREIWYLLEMFRVLDASVERYHESCKDLEGCNEALIVVSDGLVSVGTVTDASAHAAVFECGRRVWSRIILQIPKEARSASIETTGVEWEEARADSIKTIVSDTGGTLLPDTLLRRTVFNAFSWLVHREETTHDPLATYAPVIVKESVNLALSDDLEGRLRREYALASRDVNVPEGLRTVHQQAFAVMGALQRLSQAADRFTEAGEPSSGDEGPAPQQDGDKSVQENVKDYVISALRYHHMGKSEETSQDITETELIDREKLNGELSRQFPDRKKKTIESYITRAFNDLFGKAGRSGWAMYKVYCGQANWKLRNWFLGESEDVVMGSMSTEHRTSEDELQKRVAEQSDSC